MRRLLLIFALFFTSMLAFGQTPSAGGMCSTSTSSCTVSSVSVTAGQTIVVGGGSTYSSAVTFTMNDGGDTFTACSPSESSAYGGSVEAFCTVAANTGTLNFVFTFNHNYGTQEGVVEVFSNAYVLDVDAGNKATSSSTAMTAGTTATTASASDLIVGVFLSGTGSTCTVGSNVAWVSAQNGCSASNPLLEYYVPGSTGTFNAQATQASSGGWAGVTIALKPAPLTAAAPSFSPNGVVLGFTSPATTPTLTSSTSGATICYTTNGTTPTATTAGTCSTGTTLTNGGSISLSSIVTVKALATESGYANSAVSSATFTLVPDQPLVGAGSSNPETFSEFYNPVLNIDSINTTPAQLPLDTDWTGKTISSTLVSAWEGTGTSGGNYLYPAVDYLTGGYGVRGPAGAFGYASYTGVTVPANQYANMYFHYGGGSGVGGGIAVGTNGTPGSSSFTGNALSVGTGTTNNVQLYINGSLSTTVTLAPAEGDLYEMRQYGSTCQPTKNGAPVTGLSATYSCTAATGVPYIGATGGNQTSATIASTNSASNVVGISFGTNPFQLVGSQITLSGLTTATWLNGQTLTISSANASAIYAPFTHADYGITSDTGTAVLAGIPVGLALLNAVGYNPSLGAVATSNPGVSPILWGGNTYSNYASGTITSGTTLTYPTWMPDGLSGSAYPGSGLVNGNWNNALSSQYALGSPGNLSSKIEQAHLLSPFQNLYWFHQFATMDATAWNNGNYFLKFASEPYNPPSAMSPSGAGSACYDAGSGYIGTEPMMQGAVTCGASVEYCNTHHLHVTYANNLSASIANASVTMSGSAVSAVTFTNPRCLSASTATVYFWGAVGSGATGTATLTATGCVSGYQLSSVTVTAGGSYTTAPKVTIVPGSGVSQSCNAVPNYEIATAIGFETAVMHGDEVLGVYNTSTGNLSVYLKGGNTIGGWAASTQVTPRVNALTSGVTGTTIQASGLYQVAITTGFQESFPYVLNQYVFDGTNWQKVTTAGTSAPVTPTWNSTLFGTTTSAGATFTNEGLHPSLGTCTDPCTATTQPSVWGGQYNTCETTTTSGALTPDNTATWQCVGEAATNDTSFQLLGTVNVPGFNDGQFQFPGIWANNNSTGAGEYAFQDVEFGSGNPCTNGKYTCVGGQQIPFIGWMQ